MDRFKHTFRILLLIALFTVAWSIKTSPGMAAPGTAPSFAQLPTTITYDGRVNLADGTYDLRFQLWNAVTEGTLVGSPNPQVREQVAVQARMFRVPLDFGPSAFTGQERWLEIGHRPHSSTDTFTTIGRFPLRPVAYAMAVRPGMHITGDVPQPGRAVLRGDNIGTGVGVWGKATSNAGVYGESNTGVGSWGVSASNAGVYGESTSNAGVWGKSTSASGVYGESTQYNGVSGKSTAGAGVFGESTNFTGVRGIGHTVHHPAVTGINDSGGTGVYGESSAPGYNGKTGTGVIGVSRDGFGIYGQSTSFTGVEGRSTTGWGVAGVSRDGIGAYGQSGSQSGVWGKSTSGAGVAGTSDSGVGVLGRTNAGGYAMKAEGHATQTLNAGGWVKAMALVTRDGPVGRCYNSQLAGSAATSGTCGITSKAEHLGQYLVDFGFRIDDRFISVTPMVGYGDTQLNLQMISGSVVRVLVSYASDHKPTYAPFFIFVY